jgi:hypothetical protein
MKKLLLTIFATAGLMALSYGQYVDQALIFSQQNFGSTARSKAMGNAFGAIGGDFSSLSINPAGIGIYLRSEVTGTLNVLGMNSTESTSPLGLISDDRNNNITFRNFGYVMANPVQGGGSGLVSFNFGIGLNRLNNFNQFLSVGKDGSTFSRTDEYAQKTNGITSSSLFDENNPYNNSAIPWESKLAWENYLIDVVNPDKNGVGSTYQSILLQNELVNQNLSISKEGYNNEWLASFGANFNHQLYLGATIGMQDIYYNESKTYSETGEFGYFDYINSAVTKGTGYNLKLGIIYRPVPELRLGLALHTPTYFTFNEEYYWTMNSDLKNVSTAANGAHNAQTPITDYQYKMETPMRAIGSLAYQFGKMGIISFDYEYVDYTKMNLLKGGDGYNFKTENTDIKEIYRPVSNLRVGGEIKPTEALSLRAGYELFGNPYNSNAFKLSQPNKDFKYNTINAGIGYRVSNVSLDVSYSLGSRTEFSYQNLDQTNVELVKNHIQNSEVVFTLAIKL